MRFVQFIKRGSCPIQRLGIQLGMNGEIADLNAVDKNFPNSLVQFLTGETYDKESVSRLVEKAPRLPLETVDLLAPITSPDKIACVGLNYRGHCVEQNLPLPKEPIVFSKFASSITGPYSDIKYPLVSNEVDWEVELAVVIGKRGFHIPEDKALEHVFGYTIAQDISARDWQKRRNGGQFLLGKTMDTFCPLGPAVVTADEIENIRDLDISTKINGVLKQSGNTGELIHSVEAIISRISSCVTLLPGDLILTGTPAGVGMHRNPPEFLKPGDLITSEISKIGRMENNVVNRN